MNIMFKTKKCFAIILVIILAFSSVNVLAADTSINYEDFTTELSDFSKAATLSLDSIRNNVYLSDENKIKNTIEIFMEVKKDQLSNLEYATFDFSTFFDSKSEAYSDLQYICDKIVLLKELNKANDLDITWDNVSLDFRSIEITENSAVVTVYELYKYACSKYPGLTPTTGTLYTISLSKTNGIWYITDLLTADTFDNQMREKGLDVEALVSEANKESTGDNTNLFAEAIIEETDRESEYTINQIGTYYISTTKFASYARAYATSYNTLFYSYSSDCQNFASQCVWYALGGTNNSTAISDKEWPMIDGTGDHAWYQTSLFQCDPGHHWTSVEAFDDCVLAGSSTTIGLDGTVTSGVAYAKVGDIVQVDYTGDGTFDHSYVVVSVSGTDGSRTLSNITVCAHTTDRSDTVLQNITVSGNVYRTVHITHSIKFIPE
jgi:hypothetical protein